MADGNKENGNGVSCKTIHSKVLLKITVKINFLQNYDNGSSKKQVWKEDKNIRSIWCLLERKEAKGVWHLIVKDNPTLNNHNK